MQSVIEIIQTLARQRNRDTSPLLLLRQIDGRVGERISHMPVESELSQAWLALVGEPFRPHQAQALMALRRGEPVALRGAHPQIAQTAYLLLFATLLEPGTAALIVAPDRAAITIIRTALDKITTQLPQNLRRTVITVGPQMRPYRGESVIITTPDDLHARLLRHHDRAWSLLWPRLRLIVLPDVHCYSGVASAHLADLVLRLQRIVTAHATGQSPALLATLADVADPQPALVTLTGQPWRVVAGDDLPADAATLAVWRSAKDRLSEAGWLAREVQRHGFHVHIRCEATDTLALRQQLGEVKEISFGPLDNTAHVLIVAGVPPSQSVLRRALRGGHQAVIVVLGDALRDHMLARHTETLLNDPPPVWIEPPSNAYVTAQHILCAATELPLTATEVEAWGVQDLVNRLVNTGKLVDLPDPEVAWKPTDETGEPYAEFSLQSASGAAVVAYDEQMQIVDQLDPTSFERWTFTGASLPPGTGGAQVIGRDEEAQSVTLRAESGTRRTYPLRRCEVSVREEHESRTMNGRRLGWGRVLVNEIIYGYREINATGVIAEAALKPELKARWSATACWFDLAVDLQQVTGQIVGWSLVAALPLRVLACFTDVVPCYDQRARRLYIVDAQPGGNGLAAWLFANAEQVLPLAYDIALACRGDVLFEPFSRVDMDWLLTLLGRAEQAINSQQSAVSSQQLPVSGQRSAVSGQHSVLNGQPSTLGDGQRTTEARRVEFVAGPPPEPPRVLVTPPVPETAAPEAVEELSFIELPTRPQRRTTSDERRATTDTPPDRVAPSADEPRIEQPPLFPARSEQPRNDPPAPARGEPPAVASERPSPSRTRPTPPRYPPPARRAAPADTTNRHDKPANKPINQQTSKPSGKPANRQPSKPDEPRSPAPAPPLAPSPPSVEETPDPSALIKRLQRQRQQREAEQSQREQSNKPHLPQPPVAVEPRFKVGERIFCLPYGEGTVKTSTIDANGRELLSVDFPNDGELQIDPAVSLVRKIADHIDDDDDLL